MTDDKEHSLKKRLERRARSFLRPKTSEQSEICKFIDTASSHGDTYIVGGLLRDLLFHGYRKFTSDIDLVIDELSVREFDGWMKSLGAKENRFGGYGLSIGPAKFDLWHLERTWARVAGHCEVKSPRDLHNATFFDWDCILYSSRTGEILVDEGYFSRIRQRVLDIRLRQNPNPLGNAVRALRYACRYEAAFSDQLAAHVAKEIRENGWDRLVSYEKRSFNSLYLELLDGAELYQRLNTHELAPVTRAFLVKSSPEQLGLY